MGMREKITEKAMRGREPIDQGAILTKALGPDDAYKTFILATPGAPKRASSLITLSPAKYVSFKLKKLFLEKLKERKHIGGEKESMARQLPRDGLMEAVVLSTKGLSIWKLSQDPNATPVCRASLPRTTIASFASTGQTGRSGGSILRLTFTDGSFFDYNAVTWTSPGDITWMEQDFPTVAGPAA